MKRRVIGFIFLLALLVVDAAVNPIQVSAFTEGQVKDYSRNDIRPFYNPSAGKCTSEEGLKITKSEVTDSIYDSLTSTRLSSNGNKPLSAIQAAGVMGNMYAESGFNPSAIEVTDREDKGHGLVQWTFGRWANLESFAEEEGTEWDDLGTQLAFLTRELEGYEKAIFNDDQFNTTDKPAVAAMRFRIIFERADPAVAHDDKREGAAIWAFTTYGGGSASADCISGDGVIAGNLVETAVNFALPEPATNGMNTKEQARDTYQAAKEQYNPSVHWTDCGGFIATVMYATGVDPDFPNVNTDTQSAYVRGNTAKYLIIDNPSLGDLRPGDLLYTDGHVTMYTGNEKYPSVDASFYNPSTGEGGRVPSVRNSSSAQWMISHGAFIARVIK